MAYTPGLEMARLIDKMAKDINRQEKQMLRDIMIMAAAQMLGEIAEQEGIAGITDMLLSNAIQGAGVNHNARIIRDHRDGKEPGCGMCPACKAKQAMVSEEEPSKGLEDFLKAIFGGNVTIIRVDLDELEDKPTRH